MNSENKITVHQSSLIDLKAELLRKQAEIKLKKTNSDNTVTHKLKNKDGKSREKKNKEKIEKNGETSDHEDLDSMKTLKKSKLMLEAKSRLYEKLTKVHTNMNPNFLVDFENKPEDSEPSHKISDKEDYDSENYSDDEWVEYTDCFGRNRKCLREDLPKMRKEDDFLKKNVVRKQEEPTQGTLYVEDRQPTKESEIDILKKKWEEQTAKIAQKADIHYQDILFDEARTHGVGYYAFSQEGNERTMQQENLMKLRKETEQKQKDMQSIREKKENMQKNRLKLARIRKRIRAGLPAEESDEEDNLKDPVKENSCEVENKEFNQNSSSQFGTEKSEENDQHNNEDKIKAFGELLEKQNKWYVMSQEEWVEKKRGEREKEFAPFYNNFQQGETLDQVSSKKISLYSNKQCQYSDTILSRPIAPENSTTIEFKSSESNTEGPMPSTSEDSYIIGPMPPGLIDTDVIGPMPPKSAISMITVPNSNEGTTTVDIEDQVEAGLKLLRQQFEKGHAESFRN